MTAPEERRCGICARSLARLRSDARYCSRSHRTQASRLRRLEAGLAVDGYATLADYLSRRQRRAAGTPATPEMRRAELGCESPRT